LIVFGLGNPLPKYKETRHNVGFMVVDILSKNFSMRFTHHANYYVAHTKDLIKTNLALIKPMLYMNNSGMVVSDYLQSSNKHSDFIVVCDDLALPLGKMRIREKGSDGGHQGLASIIFHLQTTNFPRLRIGIGQPPVGISATDYVLTKFASAEKQVLNKVLDAACSALTIAQEYGIKAAMNKYNAVDFSGDIERL